MKPSTLPSVSLPDFRRRGFDMRLAVGDIVELVCPDRAVRLGLRQLLGKPAGDLHVVVGILVGNGRHFDEFGAEQLQRVLLFLALRFRNDDDGAIAERLGDHRQPDAGIAGRAFDDDAARLQQSLLLGVADDVERGAILDRLAGVEELRLAENGAAGRLGGALELDQRRVADGFEDGGVEGHGICLCSELYFRNGLFPSQGWVGKKCYSMPQAAAIKLDFCFKNPAGLQFVAGWRRLLPTAAGRDRIRLSKR